MKQKHAHETIERTNPKTLPMPVYEAYLHDVSHASRLKL